MADLASHRIWTGSEMIVWGGSDGNHHDLMEVTNTAVKILPARTGGPRPHFQPRPPPRQRPYGSVDRAPR